MVNKVNSIAVVGVGTQGAQIVFRAAYYGKQVIACDLKKDILPIARQKMEQWAKEYVESGKLDADKVPSLFNNIIFSSDLKDSVSNVDLVLEVVPEVLSLKQKVWAQIDSFARPDTLLTSNSSSLKSSDMGRDVIRKNLTFNVNFMTPVKDDLVEVMWNSNTDDAIKPVILEFLVSQNLIPVVTNKEIKGFSENRVWRAIKKEALRLWNEDYCDYQDIDRAFRMDFDTAYGPFGLMDIVGLDVIRDIEISYYNESGDESDKPPAKLLAMIEAGTLGCKTGKGFYSYPNPEYSDPSWMRAGIQKYNK